MRQKLRKLLNRRSVLTGLSALAGPLATPVRVLAQRKGRGPMDEKQGGRTEPLFMSETDARDVMREHCMQGVDVPMTAKQVDLLASRLRPQFWMAPRPDAATGGLGATRFGGTPDLPKTTPWPIRPIAANVATIAEQWKSSHGWIIKQLQHALPFEFIGQIDLSEAARLPTHAANLPTSGRLHFFWDGALGFLETGPHTCHVIFDESPIADLARMDLPARFADMEAWWREPDPKQIEHFNAMARSFEKSGQKDLANTMREVARKSEKPDPKSTKPFVYPARAKRLVPLWVLPKQNAIELTLDKDLTAFADGDDTREHYSLLTSNDIGPFTADPSNMRRSQDWLTLQSRRSRFMGPPEPEQDDPRFNTLDPSELPPYPWNDAQIAAAARKADEWQLLLQVSIADLSQIQTEGTVYFMIAKADLAKRDFSRVVASYQQT
jgi:Domain of unknown function (DUF1963)